MAALRNLFRLLWTGRESVTSFYALVDERQNYGLLG